MNILDVEDKLIATIVNQIHCQSYQNNKFIDCLGPTYIVIRDQGRQIFASWRYELNLVDAVHKAVDEAVLHFQAQAFSNCDTIELCLTHSFKRIQFKEFKSVFSNVHRGIRGIELQYRSNIVRYSPTQIIATNRSYQKIFDSFLERESISAAAFEARGGIIQMFEARQVLVSCNSHTSSMPSMTGVTLHRGSSLVNFEEISKQIISQTIQGMGNWLLRQVKLDGRMLYKYWPSSGKEASSNNTIRQFMATICLIRYFDYTQQPEHLAIATRNLEYNLNQFYRVESGIGIIEYNNSAKLGAAALAALAILEHPQRENYTDVFDHLRCGIKALWQPDGSFRTFHKPPKRNDNQNFYPGEALLFLASLYQSNREPKILQQSYQSFRYYRNWHRSNHNPAFIPWHTQAYALLFEATGDPAFSDFIFEMNDWLLSMQQWEKVEYMDLQGRFYNPKHPEYGPPHASSTGVYLEGLIEAYRIANLTGENKRAKAYKKAVLRGIRSLQQLQFKDERDMFYISQKNYVLGGLRTTVYDNTIRVDNIQHGLMALLKLNYIPEILLP